MYPDQLNIVLIGQIYTGKTSFLSYFSQPNSNHINATMQTTTKQTYQLQINKSKMKLNFIDTRGFALGAALAWSKFDEYANTQNNYIIFMREQKENSLKCAEQSLKILTEQYNIPKQRISFVFNTEAEQNEPKKIDKRLAYAFCFDRDMILTQRQLLYTPQLKKDYLFQTKYDIIKPILMKRFFQLKSNILEQVKICLLGGLDSKHNELFLALTNQKVQKLDKQTYQKTVWLQIQQRNIKLSLNLSQSFDASIPQNCVYLGKLIAFKNFIIVFDLAQTEKEYFYNFEQLKSCLADWKKQEKIQNYYIVGCGRSKATKSFQQIKKQLKVVDIKTYFQVQKLDEQTCKRIITRLCQEIVIQKEIKNQQLKLKMKMKQQQQKKKQQQKRIQQQSQRLRIEQQERRRVQLQNNNRINRLKRGQCQVY